MSATVDVEKIIDELRFSLEHDASEEKVLGAIDESLTALRQSFRFHKSIFTPNHICFLRSLAGVSGQLRTFIELKEELADVGTLEDYADMVSRLSGIRCRLRPFAVYRRVMRELRGLNEKLPTIRQQNDGKWRVQVNARIIDLERKHARCQRNHAMVISKGPYDYYWGCSRYPFCGDATRLTAEERRQLDS